MNLSRILTIVAVVIGVVSILMLGSILGAGDEAIQSGAEAGVVNPLMYIAYVVFIIAVAATLVFTVVNTFTNASGLKNTLIGVGAFAVIGLICYFVLATGQKTVLREGELLSESGSRLVGAGLYMFYILAAGAIGAMLFTGIKKMIS